MTKSTIIFFATIIVAVHAIGRKCPDVQVQKNFNVTGYLGLWYDVEKYPFRQSIGGKCVSALYGPGENGTVSVYNSNIAILTGKERSITGYAEVVDDGKLAVTFPSIGGAEAPYWILETDYVNYSVVWACRESGKFKLFSNLWILTRERVPSKDILNKAYAVLDKNKLSRKFLTKTNQKGCEKY